MTLLRKASWATMILAAMAAGCSVETSTTTTTSDATPETVAPKADMPKIDPVKAEEPKADAPKTEEPKADAPKVEAPKTEEPKADAPKTGKLSDDEIKEIKTLPADEQDAALKQAKCPVSDEALGSMGAPIKVTAEGKTFYICCKGCAKEVETNPKEVVAKLAK